MSTNHTQNYSLCQWEPADRVLREDFNADNAALDAALARIEATASAAKTQAQQLSDTAYTTGFPPFVAGAYSGNNVNGRVIELGFRPNSCLWCLRRCASIQPNFSGWPWTEEAQSIFKSWTMALN